MMPTKKIPSTRKKISKKIAIPNKEINTSENTPLSGVAYATVIGWLIAYFASSQGLNDYDRFHIRQAFGLHMTMLFFEILGSFSMVPYVLTRLVWLAYIITMVVLMIQAWRNKRIKIVFLGDRFQQWFSFL